MNTLIGVGALARMVVGNLRYRRLILRVMTVVVLAVMTAVLASALLLVGFYAAYLALLRHGIDADAALLTTGGFVFLVTALLGLMTVNTMSRLKDALMPLPSDSLIRRISTAFLDGFAHTDHAEK